MTTFSQLKKTLLNCCCPPGNGVYTVHTGSQQRYCLQRYLYGEQDAKSAWQASLELLPNNPQPLIMGICSDSGGGILRGANWGPLAVREALYAFNPKIQLFELGDIRVIPQLLLDDYLNNDTIERCSQALYGQPHIPWPVSPLSMAAYVSKEIYQVLPNSRLLGLGGDHSISYPLVTAYLTHAFQRGKHPAVIHFDAHTDLLEERLGIPICFGSWAYHALSFLPNPACWVQVGIRSSAEVQTYWETKLGVKQYWANEIRTQGAKKVAKHLRTHLEANQVDELYITFDIDALDATEAAATGTPEAGGLTMADTLLLLEELCHFFPLRGADLVEVAPFVSAQYSHTEQLEPATTLEHAAQIVDYLVGRIGL